MSTHINTDKPLSEDDERYLAQRGRTPEQQADRQEHVARVAETVAHDEERAMSDTAYVKRNGGRR